MVCAAVAIGINLSAKAKMSPLMLANLEALTDDEARLPRIERFFMPVEYYCQSRLQGRMCVSVNDEEKWCNFGWAAESGCN